MALIIKNQNLWVDGLDITGQTNQVSLECGATALDNTTLGDSTRSNVSGLLTVSLGASGFDDAALINEAQFNSVGSSDKLVTVAQSAADGARVHFFKSTISNYNVAASVGELLTYDFSAAGNADPVRGQIMENDTSRSTASTGGSNRYNLGAVSSTQKLHLGVHIFSVDSPTDTITVRVESDSTNAFGGGTTTRMTTPALSGVRGHYQFVAGPITHTWYRVVFSNVTGSSPSFNIVALLGII